MRFSPILSMIFYVSTIHIRCNPTVTGDIERLRVMVIPYRHTDQGTQVLLSFPKKSGKERGYCFPRGKLDLEDVNDLATAARELKEETGYENAHFSNEMYNWEEEKHAEEYYRVKTFVYLAEIEENAKPGDGKDVGSRTNVWFHIDKVRDNLTNRLDSVKAWEVCGDKIPKPPESSNSGM
ncbi:uncharacterized protein MELLADRAFT_68716 [Melampsora larici-populina 98AG31]|uniref:Secreted protein n=1 Tax=Melampsora larici-populina (strain 98AG31 / pathotype 3-4-7) TaxID=747676 RepID=F4S7X7_MELLP|nr:uncharacterized protein MELLADRAFT_68716 [Melampsora larici-populina 98AG31]EGF99252.1 secreted protein [Melampsora larici-populina 98AG31]